MFKVASYLFPKMPRIIKTSKKLFQSLAMTPKTCSPQPIYKNKVENMENEVGINNVKDASIHIT